MSMAAATVVRADKGLPGLGSGPARARRRWRCPGVAVRQRLREHRGRVDIRRHRATLRPPGVVPVHLQPAAGDVDVDVHRPPSAAGEGIQEEMATG